MKTKRLTIDDLKNNYALCITCIYIDDYKGSCPNVKKEWYLHPTVGIKFINKCDSYKPDWINIIRCGEWIPK